MRRSIAIAVALVLMVVGLLGFATEAFVAIGCVILVLGSLMLAIALGLSPEEDDEHRDER
jgi:hypothetical protein